MAEVFSGRPYDVAEKLDTLLSAAEGISATTRQQLSPEILFLHFFFGLGDQRDKLVAISRQALDVPFNDPLGAEIERPPGLGRCDLVRFFFFHGFTSLVSRQTVD